MIWSESTLTTIQLLERIAEILDAETAGDATIEGAFTRSNVVAWAIRLAIAELARVPERPAPPSQTGEGEP